MKKEIIIGMAFALTSAVAYGVSHVLIRQAASNYAPPIVVAAISLLSGTMVLAVINGRNPEKKLGRKKKALLLLTISGIFSGLGVLTGFLALSMAEVVVISPLLGTPPLFTLAFSHFFLRKLERITPRLILGIVLVIGGITLISIGKATLY